MDYRRLKRISLVAQSVFRFLTVGPATKIPAHIERIIVVPTGKLGDIICCTPVFAAIRAHMPEVKIFALGNAKQLRAILNDSNLVDEYIDLDDANIIENIQKSKAQAGIVTGPSFGPTALLYIAGVPLVVAPTVVGGYSPSETKPYKILKKCIKTYPYGIFEYAPRERLRSLEPLGIITDETKKHLGFSVEAGNKVESLLKEKNITLGEDFVVVLSPTAGNKIKEWPEERFAQVADYFSENHNCKIVLLGGPNDKDAVQKTKTLMKSDAVEFTNLSIDELKAFISKINLFVAVDTGPIYIAEAFGIPTIDIVGPVDERVQPPRGKLHKNVVPERKKAELFILNARAYDAVEAERQTKSVTVEHVIKAADEIIAVIRLDQA